MQVCLFMKMAKENHLTYGELYEAAVNEMHKMSKLKDRLPNAYKGTAVDIAMPITGSLVELLAFLDSLRKSG